MDSTIIQQGVDLMLFGMGTVFVFLTLLVIGTSFMSAIASKFFPDAVLPPPGPAIAPTNQAGSVDSKTLAIIQDAIHQHRSSGK